MPTKHHQAKVGIIGGGVIGTSVLSHLSMEGWHDSVLFEKNQLGSGSTSKAAGGVRHVFQKPFNIELGKKNIEYFENFESNVGHDVKFHQSGYLYILHSKEELEEWEKRMVFLEEYDVNVKILTPEQTVDLFPDLDPSSFIGSAFAPKCGHVDPSQVTQAYAKRATELGAEIETKTEVTDVSNDGDSGFTITTSAGIWEVEHVVNAAGPWAEKIAEWVDVELPIDLMARHIAVTSPVNKRNSPLIIDNHLNTYFRSEENGSMLVCDMDSDIHDIPSPEHISSNEIGYDNYLNIIEKLDGIVNNIGGLDIINGWTGVQSHTPDKSPIVGESPIDNYWLACGFAGHGIQKSPLTGKILTDLIIKGKSDHIDIHHFSYDRFDENTDLDGEPLNM